MRRLPGITVLIAAITVLAVAPVRAAEPHVTGHPRLLFSTADIPALRAKLSDGGRDDEAWSFIQHLVKDVYPGMSMDELLGLWYAEGAIQNLGLVAHLDQPPDTVALVIGKAVVYHIMNTWEPDFDEAQSGMRLHALALGYDLFFADAPEAERAPVRTEMVRYIQKMVWNQGYRIFEMQPYLANHSAMFGAALGLAAIVLDGEVEPYLLADALAMADRIAQGLLTWMFDAGGSYNEGDLYALWTLKNLVPYFEARKRYDGFAYSSNPRLRGMEEWLAYELLPEGGARSHNLNDTVITGVPFARNTAYFDWAIHEWGSGLSSWIWEHAAGAYGVDLGIDADKAYTALWHENVALVPPGDVLPLHRIWVGRGLYHFRTGWQQAGSSDDVMFSFYSGKYQGGHAQEDQNQFALYGYGERLVIDHGAGAVGKESEAHNMVFIDGRGQHNAGGSVGTDGRMAAYLLGGLADYVVGDATQAYGTYSEYNLPDRPYEGADWSWGYSGANPVEFAFRRVVAVHGASAPPYFLIMDDIRKDGAEHTYQWRLHTLAVNNVDVSSNPMRISGTRGALDVRMIAPSFSSASISTALFDNGSPEADARVVKVSVNAVEPDFAFLLVPRYAADPEPGVTTDYYTWGYVITLQWAGGRVDHLMRNNSGALVSHGTITSDALITVVRENGGALEGYLIADGTHIDVAGITHVSVGNGTMSCELSGPTLYVDRYDADFRVRNSGINTVLYREQELGFAVDGDYIVSGGTTGVGVTPPKPALELFAQPNPFNPVTTVRITGNAQIPTRVAVYDVAGRHVRMLWNAPLGVASRSITWDGRNEAGVGVASGVYIVRATSADGAASLKLTLLK